MLRSKSRLLSALLASMVTCSALLPPGGSVAFAESDPPSYLTKVPNGSFEEMTTQDSWIAKDWLLSKDTWITNAAAQDGSYSQTVDQYNKGVTLSQELTNIQQGLYTVSLYVWADGSLKESRLEANSKTTAITSAGATQIDGTLTWDHIEIQKVRVEENGKMTICIVIDDIDDNVKGYIDNVSFTRTGELPVYPTDPSDGSLQNGGFDSSLEHWVISDSAVVLNDGWGPSGENDKKLSVYHESKAVDVDIVQHIKGLREGSYTVKASVSTNGSHATAVLYANTYNGSPPVEQPLTANTDGAWVPVTLNATVEDEGYLSIGFRVTGPAEMWLGIDAVEVTYNDPFEGGLIPNNGFEQEQAHWTIAGEIVEEGHHGSGHALAHKGAAALDSNQTISGLENGYYTLSAWTQNTGGMNAQDVSYIYAEVDGLSRAMTALPRSNFPYDPTGVWKKVTLRGIKVTDGNMAIGLYTKGEDANTVCRIDNFQLVRDGDLSNPPYELLIGGDITELTYVEDMGGKYYDLDGAERDPLEILAENGWNIVRIRVYNHPGKERGDGTYYVPEGYQDVADALKLAKRAKNAGLQIQLSLHYSDYWTNPGTQMIPHDWQPLLSGKSDTGSVGILQGLIYDFTKDVLEQMQAQNTVPEYVSIGNETRSGMLFPYGSTGNWSNLAKLYNAGSKAVRDQAPDAKVIIHLDDGGNLNTYRTYFTNAQNHSVDYDMIGTSYYPFWTQKSSKQFADFAHTVSTEFGKPVICMETGMNWSGTTGAGHLGQLNDNGPYGNADSSSPALQRDFMIEQFNEMQAVENGTCIGSLYWDPIMLYANGRTGWAYFEATGKQDVNVVDNTTLFDVGGKALPVLAAYRYNTRGIATGFVAGKVVDRAEKPVSQAEVTIGSHTAVTNRLGHYFVAGVNPGDYTISVAKEGLGASLLSANVQRGETTKAEVIRLEGTQVLHTFAGTITNGANGSAVEDALVKLSSDGFSFVNTTDAAGAFLLQDIPSGSYTVQVMMEGYVTKTDSLSITENTSLDYSLSTNTGSVSGIVYDSTRTPLEGAIVTLNGETKTSKEDGTFSFDAVQVGSVTITASKSGFMNGRAANIRVALGQSVSGVEVTLPLILSLDNPGFENGLQGWNVTQQPDTAVYTQSGGHENSQSKISAWCDSGISYEGDVHQKVDLKQAGNYILNCYVQNGGGQKALFLYAKDGHGKILGQTNFPISNDWSNTSLRFSTPAGEVLIGFYVKSEGGTWCNADDFSLGLEGVQSHVPVSSLSISGGSMVAGQTRWMTASVSPANATNRSLTWSIVSGNEFASITESGLLSALREGFVTIRAAAMDGSGVSTELRIEILPATPIDEGNSQSTSSQSSVVSMQSNDKEAGLNIRESQLPVGVGIEDIHFRAERLPLDSPIPAIVQHALVSHSLPEIKGITTYDLKLLDHNGRDGAFHGDVLVSLPMPADYGHFLRVFHITEQGILTEIPCLIRNSRIEFRSSHFSHFVIVDFASSPGRLPAEIKASSLEAAKPHLEEGIPADNDTNPKTGSPSLQIIMVLMILAAVITFAMLPFSPRNKCRTRSRS